MQVVAELKLEASELYDYTDDKFAVSFELYDPIEKQIGETVGEVLGPALVDVERLATDMRDSALRLLSPLSSWACLRAIVGT